MNDNYPIPLHLAELLHATLGPLADVLEARGDGWGVLAKRVLWEYETSRDRYLTERYGPAAVLIAQEHLVQSVDQVDHLVTEMIGEETDFAEWAKEFKGETA